MDKRLQELEKRLSALENSFQVGLPAELVSSISHNLKAHESLRDFLQSAIKTELLSRHAARKRLARERSEKKPRDKKPRRPAGQRIPTATATPPSDKKIDILSIKLVINQQQKNGLYAEHMQLIPRSLHALMEYDLLDSIWFPRDNWEELMHDFLANGQGYTLEKWLDFRRQKELEEVALAWLKIGQDDD